MRDGGNGRSIVENAPVPAIRFVPDNIVRLWMRIVRMIGGQVPIPVEGTTYLYAAVQRKHRILDRRQDFVT